MPKEQNVTPILSVRLPLDLLTRIDAYTSTANNAQPGAKIERSDAVRILLTLALNSIDASRKPTKGTKQHHETSPRR